MANQLRKYDQKWRKLEWVIPFCAVILLFVLNTSLANSYSYAWLFGNNTADNSFITPKAEISVEESNDGNTFGVWTPQDIAWGGTVGKYTRFTNTGESAIVIRACYAQHWSVTEGVNVIYLNNLYDNGTGYVSAATPNWLNGGFLNNTLWYDGGDGWFYYRLPLPAGGSTQTVLESVTFVTPVPEGYGAADYSLIFTVEGCQYSVNPNNENQQAVSLTFGKTYTETGGILTWS
jgi:hypothetical protein